MSQANNQPKSDVEQAVDNLKVDKLAENLDGSEPQKPVSLKEEEQTSFIDDELRTDK